MHLSRLDGTRPSKPEVEGSGPSGCAKLENVRMDSDKKIPFKGYGV